MRPPVRSLDRVETELRRIREVEGGLAAEKLRLLREADRMQAALTDGARTLADWVAARLDLAPETARTLVATARGLEDSPTLEQALADGLVSLDRTVELVRAQRLGLDLSEHWGWDIAGLRSQIAKRRRRTRTEDREAFEGRYLTMQPSLDLGIWRIHGMLAGADGQKVESVLERRADQISTDTGEDRPSLAQRRADALVDLCETNSGNTASSSEPLVTVFVDTEGTTVNGHLPVGGDTIEEALCIGRLEIIDIADPTRPLARGRRTRVISPGLRRTVLHRDAGRCVVEGCQSRYRLQAHHVIPWSQGGPTDPDNLATLCWYHHHVVVHGQGRRLDPHTPPHRRRFIPEPGRSPPP